MDIAALKRLGARRKKALDEANSLAEELRPLAEQALREGMPPVEVAKLTHWSPAQVRIIARTAGIGPAQRGRRATRKDA